MKNIKEYVMNFLKNMQKTKVRNLKFRPKYLGKHERQNQTAIMWYIAIAFIAAVLFSWPIWIDILFPLP